MMLNKFIIFLGFVSLLACQKDDGEYVYYDNPPRQEQSDSQYDIPNLFNDTKIDILFVVDNSGSMGGIQKNIVVNSELFMANFLKNNFMKWKVGIISTDRGDDPYLGFKRKFDYQLTHDPNHTDATIVSMFKTAVNSLGTSGDASEFVFYNTLRMMTDGRFNNFFRSDAHLAVIMVTDEKEQSYSRYGAKYEVYSLLNSIRALKDSESIVRFYGAFDFADLQDCNSYGDVFEGSPFETIINETGGLYMSACSDDFGTKLADIGKDIVRIIDSPRLLLKQRPRIETLEVYCDGKLLPAGKRSEGGMWFYSKKYNSINFYNLDFVEDFKNGKIRIKYDINDGINRD